MIQGAEVQASLVSLALEMFSGFTGTTFEVLTGEN